MLATEKKKKVLWLEELLHTLFSKSALSSQIILLQQISELIPKLWCALYHSLRPQLCKQPLHSTTPVCVLQGTMQPFHKNNSPSRNWRVYQKWQQRNLTVTKKNSSMTKIHAKIFKVHYMVSIFYRSFRPKIINGKTWDFVTNSVIDDILPNIPLGMT